MVNQQQPISQSIPKRLSPNARQSMINLPLIAATTIGVFLLGLSGLTLLAAVTALVLATPALLLVSPILVPAVIVLFLITTGLLFAGGSAVAAMVVLTWIYEHIGGRKTIGAGRFKYAKMGIQNNARYLIEKAKEYGQYLQQQAEAR